MTTKNEKMVNVSNETKTAEKNVDMLNLSIFSKTEKGRYNYLKIFSNLDWLVKNRIISEANAEAVKKAGEKAFCECKTKFGEFSDVKKKIRHFTQNLKNRIDSEKNAELKKELQKNLDILENKIF